MKTTIQTLKTILSAKDFIVTGSYALSEFGLMPKSQVMDIDIILVGAEQSTIDTINRLMVEFPAKTKPKAIEKPKEDEETPKFKKAVTKNPPLQAIFMYNGHKVDVFLTDNYSDQTVIIDSVKYSTIPHIINAKKTYGRMKDWLQCRDMARLFFKQEEFESRLNSGNWKSMLISEY